MEINKEVLDTYTLKELRDFVAASNIKAFSELAKPELIAKMLTHKVNFSEINPKLKKGQIPLPPNVGAIPDFPEKFEGMSIIELARRCKLPKKNKDKLYSLDPQKDMRISKDGDTFIEAQPSVIWDDYVPQGDKSSVTDGILSYLSYYHFYPAALHNLKGYEKSAVEYFLKEWTFYDMDGTGTNDEGIDSWGRSVEINEKGEPILFIYHEHENLDEPIDQEMRPNMKRYPLFDEQYEEIFLYANSDTRDWHEDRREHEAEVAAIQKKYDELLENV